MRRGEERDERFRAAQARHFTVADPAQFDWQVAGPGFAPLERALLAPVAAEFATPYLEVGCGEGANFVHVGGEGLRAGVDRFPAKLAFARSRLPGVGFVAADAAALPFATARVRCVLIRDLLHHVIAPERVLTEAVRVLVPGGRLFVIEPNGANPLVAVQGRLVRAEAGLRTSRRQALGTYLAAQPLVDVRLELHHPLPLRRLVLHHRFGLPALGRVALVARGLDALERVAAAVVPRSRWAYFVFSARRAGAA
jgi:SAM-dependent methyltransferase